MMCDEALCRAYSSEFSFVSRPRPSHPSGQMRPPGTPIRPRLVCIGPLALVFPLPMNPWILPIAIAYLLGSIPFGYLLVRIFKKEDIREKGSGNIGATNVARAGAKGLGVATLLLDLGKAYAGVAIAQHLVPGNFDVAVAAAVASVVGHVFPVWLGFRGGKGVASALGVYLALSWPAALGIFVVFVVVFALTRYVSLASIAGAVSFTLVGV